jgi:hypothetical protein
VCGALNIAVTGEGALGLRAPSRTEFLRASMDRQVVDTQARIVKVRQ